MKIIIITGSVGTGKTTLAKKLCNKLLLEYIDVNKIIAKYRIAVGYDRKRRSKIVDAEKLIKALIKEINNIKKANKKYSKNKAKNGIVIDSHLSHCLPKKYVDLCIVTKCELKELKKRLKRRKYPEEKIRENLDAEIFDICLNEAREEGHKAIVIDTTKGINISEIFRKTGGLIGI